MTVHSVLQALFAQTWQLAALAAAVAIGVRYTARNRPHLAHALWLVVLLKCVTPPVWHSPIGVFSWLSPSLDQETIEATRLTLTGGAEYDATSLVGIDDCSLGPVGVTASARAANEFAINSDVLPDVDFVEVGKAMTLGRGDWWTRSMLVVWGAGVVAMAVIAAVRIILCWRRLRKSEVETYPEVEALVAQLRKNLRVRRAVRLLVTDSRIGPAVIGLFRPTILLPACVLSGRSADELEPIVAHELIHIRRGDLWVGLLQTVAQAVWWFHPLVWLASRMISREVERCCDEEVIGELRCDPTRYARSLLGVLEWKRYLITAPAVPGVRAVEITSKRLERIMTLGQGCRRRTPWWCWGTTLLVAALSLPGSALQLQGDEPADRGETGARLGTIDGVAVSPAPSQKPDAPIEYPPERNDWQGRTDGKSSDDAEWNLGMDCRVPRLGRAMQVWGVVDLLSTIEKQLTVNHAEAKKILWTRLYCEKVNAVSAAGNATADSTLAGSSSVAANPGSYADTSDKAIQTTDPNRKPFWSGDTLVLSEDPKAAKRTKAAIELMRKYGFESVEIEVRFATAPLETITAVSNRWTTLPMKRATDGEAEFDTGKAPIVDSAGGVASFALEKNLPVIFDVLAKPQARKLMENLRSDHRTVSLQAPRVRVNNGQTAAVFDRTQTPFVVGFQDNKPQISVISEGTTVRARPVLVGEKVRLDFEIVFTGIRSVEEVKVQGPGGSPTKIQVPEVAQSRVAATVDVPLGQTVLIAGVKEVGDAKSSSPMAVLLTVKKPGEDRTAAPAADSNANRENAQVETLGVPRNRAACTIVGPVTSGGDVKLIDPPAADEILRALAKTKGVDGTSPTAEDQRRDVRVQLELIAEYRDPPRMYPLIGRAQQHHAHYKCTIVSSKTTDNGRPLQHSAVAKGSRDVFYVDHNHFHVVDHAGGAAENATEAATDVQRVSHDEKNDTIYIVTYAAADLVIPIPNTISIAPEKDAKPQPAAKADFAPLLELIKTTIRPESWTDNAGECSIKPFPQNLSLVVSQTAKGHEDLSTLVSQLRANLDKQIVLNCRSVTDPGDLFRLIKCNTAATEKSGMAMLRPEIVAQAHAMTEAKGGANVKLTVFNGQQLKLRASDGTARFLIVQALVSPGDGTPRLRLADSTEGPRPPRYVEKTNILECGSLLVDATKFPFRDEYGIAPPATKIGEKPKPLYVLITPQVIHASDNETKGNGGSR
jgi:beta-lactamase regulating signal transducer with metallopeptidase domain